MEEEKITDDSVLRAVATAFKHMDVIYFQQRLNEMLVKTPDYDGNWRLVTLIQIVCGNWLQMAQ